ncbi:hypothetical protein PHYNN_244 [Pantoea phage Phynn]|nr:hypothetical protein PHYNN_244 [Pantoea phage Phynn]
MKTYWICFSDGLTIEGSVRYAKAYCALNGATFSILAETRMKYEKG